MNDFAKRHRAFSRISGLARRGLIAATQMRDRFGEALPTPVGTAEPAPVRVHAVNAPREEDPPPLRHQLGDVQLDFWFPPRHVHPGSSIFEIPDGWSLDRGNVIADADGRVHPELSHRIDPHLDRYQPVDAIVGRRRGRRLEGSVAVLGSPGGGGYYHWTTEVLARWALIDLAGLASEIDHVLVPEMLAPFHHESLDRLGVADRARSALTHSNIRADRLIVPSITATLNRCDGVALRHVAGLLGAHPTRSSRGNRRIYVERSGTAFRRLVNRAEVRDVLRGYGFELVAAETLSIDDKVKVFGEASCIAGVHGAGLCNQMFASSGIDVVSFMNAEALTSDMWSVTAALGNQLHLVTDGAPVPEPNLSTWRALGSDVTVDIAQLTATLERLD